MLTLSMLVCMQLITNFQIFGCKNRVCVAIGHGFFRDSEDSEAVVILCEFSEAHLMTQNKGGKKTLPSGS